MKIYTRDNQEIVANQSQSRILQYLYGNLLGRLILKILTLPFITHLGGWYMNSRLSCRQIKSFIKNNHIDMSRYEDKQYDCYNDFFTRQVKTLKVDQNNNHLISPADSKLTYYPITDETLLSIKNTVYSLKDLLNNEELASHYQGGICLIFRLTVDDYHRYCFIDSGKKEKDQYIPGRFHTVNPIANDYYPIYKQNARSYTVLHTQNFGQVVQMEVGAMMVGKICNHDIEEFKRGEEKGYFEFGGSTIVVLLEKDRVVIDQDIVERSQYFDETKVSIGEKIGVKYKEL